MKKKKFIFIFIIVVLIMIIFQIFLENNRKSKVQNQVVSDLIEQSTASEITNQTKTEVGYNKKILGMQERSRMQSYIGQFLAKIEDKKYEEAYNLLQDGFKENYFKDVEALKKYFEKYPKIMSVKYNNIEREGKYFILEVEIFDSFNEKFNKIVKRVVVEEMGINKYKISFQV